jgi:hypothetical protein
MNINIPNFRIVFLLMNCRQWVVDAVLKAGALTLKAGVQQQLSGTRSQLSGKKLVIELPEI